MHNHRHTSRGWQTALILLAVSIIFVVFSAGGFAAGQDKPAVKASPKGDPYPLDTCIVSGEKLGSMGKPVVKQYEGREVRFCCNGCVKEFEKDQAGLLKKTDDKIIEHQLKHYPLTTCVVMADDSLAEAGEQAYNMVYRNRLVRFCCTGCVSEFEADPAKYITKLNEAVIKQQKESYPLDVCPISSEKLGAGAVDYVIGVSLVRFCCDKCIAKFESDPSAHLVKVREAWAAKHSKAGGGHAHDHDHGDHKH